MPAESFLRRMELDLADRITVMTGTDIVNASVFF